MGYLLDYARGYAAGVAAAPPVVIPSLSGGAVQRTARTTETITSDVSVSFSLSKPGGSSATLTAASGTSTSFTEDVNGYYEVTATHASGGSAKTGIGLRLPLPTFTLGTVADQVDLSAPTMPGISGLSATGTPTYAWTLTDPLGADASALLTGPTTATPTCAALSTWTGTKLCGRWTGTVTVTDDAGSTTKSFGWTVGVNGMRRVTLSFVGQTRDFKVDSSPLEVGGVIFAPTNPGNSQVFRFSSGALEIQPTATAVVYSSASQAAPYTILDLAQINPSYTRTRRCRLQVKITHPSNAAQNQQALVGFRGEQANSFAGVRVHGHLTTRYHKAVVISTSAESGQSNVNEVIGLVVLVKCGNHYELYTAAAGSDYLEEGDAGLTLRKIFSTDNEPGDTDLYDGGESLLIGSPNNGSTGVPDILRFTGIRLDVEV